MYQSTCVQLSRGAGLVLIKASAKAVVVAIIYVVVVDDGFINYATSPSAASPSTPAPAVPILKSLPQQYTAQEARPSAQQGRPQHRVLLRRLVHSLRNTCMPMKCDGAASVRMCNHSWLHNADSICCLWFLGRWCCMVSMFQD